MKQRLPLAVEAGALGASVPGRVLVVGPTAGADLSALAGGEITILHDMMPDAEIWRDAGYEVVQDLAEGARFDVALVVLPRAKKLARAWIAQAVAASGSAVLVDGQKTDGVEALMKDVRKVTGISGSVSKAHGKLFWFAPADGFSSWRGHNDVLDDRWQVAPGVFSADEVDPGSALLADALPVSLSGRVADLGAGWGYLSAKALEVCSGIEELHLIEAQYSALACARENVDDPRAEFHWADATRFEADIPFDHVLMNPPFHTGRAADSDLGRRFIAAAAGILRPGGTLWMVANRHLPYEDSLRANFAQVREIGGDGRYKLFQAVLGGRKRGRPGVS